VSLKNCPLIVALIILLGTQLGIEQWWTLPRSSFILVLGTLFKQWRTLPIGTLIFLLRTQL